MFFFQIIRLMKKNKSANFFLSNLDLDFVYLEAIHCRSGCRVQLLISTLELPSARRKSSSRIDIQALIISNPGKYTAGISSLNASSHNQPLFSAQTLSTLIEKITINAMHKYTLIFRIFEKGKCFALHITMDALKSLIFKVYLLLLLINYELIFKNSPPSVSLNKSIYQPQTLYICQF